MMIYFLFVKRKPKIKERRERRFGVRSIFQKRKRLDEFSNLFMQLRLRDRDKLVMLWSLLYT